MFVKHLFVFLLSPFIAFASDYESNQSKIFEKDFVLEANKNSVPFEKYDSRVNQFDKFFGLKIDYENDDKINFEDLSLTVDSKNIRTLFDRKLKEMTIKNKTTSSPFYLEKL